MRPRAAGGQGGLWAARWRRKGTGIHGRHTGGGSGAGKLGGLRVTQGPSLNKRGEQKRNEKRRNHRTHRIFNHGKKRVLRHRCANNVCTRYAALDTDGFGAQEGRSGRNDGTVAPCGAGGVASPEAGGIDTSESAETRRRGVGLPPTPGPWGA